MFKIILTENQLNALMSCLDTQLRQGGLQSMGMIVDLYNVMQRAEKVDEKKAEEK